MLDTFLQLVKHLVLLAQERQTVDRNLFDHHVEPIYTRAREVAQDYRGIFEGIKRDLEDESKPIDETIRSLAERRKRVAIVREELRQYSDAVISSRVAKKIEPFCWACLGLVSSEPSSDSPEGEQRPSPSLSVGLLNDLQYYREHDTGRPIIARSDYAALVDPYLRKAEDAWESIMTEYFSLRTSLLH